MSRPLWTRPRRLRAGGFRIAALVSFCLALGASSASAQTDDLDPFAELGPPRGAGAIDASASIPGVRVQLRGIDKLTGEVQTIDAEVARSVQLWRLEIKVEACFRRPAERAPESSVFLQIFDTKDSPAEQLFSGWMFASSPALSAMDHARYDVWVISCITS